VTGVTRRERHDPEIEAFQYCCVADHICVRCDARHGGGVCAHLFFCQLSMNRAAPPRDTRKYDVVMFRFAYAVLAAAVIAAAFTLLTAASGRLDAGPPPAAKEAALKKCTQRPWPYLNCVGTPVGNPHVRLVSTDQL
jgi:hypothetical protein